MSGSCIQTFVSQYDAEDNLHFSDGTSQRKMIIAIITVITDTWKSKRTDTVSGKRGYSYASIFCFFYNTDNTNRIFFGKIILNKYICTLLSYTRQYAL